MNPFGKLPQLKYDEVVSGLKRMGFVPLPKKSTSHEQWAAENPYRKVTVDKHIAPFSISLVKAMAKQADISPREFCRICKGDK